MSPSISLNIWSFILCALQTLGALRAFLALLTQSHSYAGKGWEPQGQAGGCPGQRLWCCSPLGGFGLRPRAAAHCLCWCQSQKCQTRPVLTYIPQACRNTELASAKERRKASLCLEPLLQCRITQTLHWLPALSLASCHQALKTTPCTSSGTSLVTGNRKYRNKSDGSLKGHRTAAFIWSPIGFTYKSEQKPSITGDNTSPASWPAPKSQSPSSLCL